MPIELRAATADDVEAIATLWCAGWVDAHEGRVPEPLLEHRTIDSFRGHVPVRLDTTTIAVVDGRLAGFVVTYRDEVEQLYIERGFRGTGVATCLLHHGEQAVAGAHDRAWLAVVEGNHRARRFYERSGWRDGGPFSTEAWTTQGTTTISVPVRRYEKELVRHDSTGAPTLAGMLSGGNRA